MCACGRRRGTVGAAVRRHGGNARQEGRRINGKGGEARKERHGKFSNLNTDVSSPADAARFLFLSPEFFSRELR